MAFFDKIKNIFTEEKTDGSDIYSKVSTDNGENNKNLGDKVIEKSLLGIKKYYELKVKVVNQITDINPEWEFYDKNIQEKRVEAISKRVKNMEVARDKIKDEISKGNKNIGNFIGEICDNDVQIKNLENKRSYAIGNEYRSLETQIDRLKEKNNKLNYSKKEEVNRVEELRNNKVKLENDIKDVYFLMITEISYIEHTYERCINISNKYKVYNNFISLGLVAIDEYEKGNVGAALDCVRKYFEKEQNNFDVIHHPTIDTLYSQLLIHKKRFNEAKVFLEYAMKFYPDSVQLHKLLYGIHVELDEQNEAELERKILELLA